MPNEIKNVTPVPVSDFSSEKRKSSVGSSTATVTIWTISGIVLAACGGGTRVIGQSDGQSQGQGAGSGPGEGTTAVYVAKGSVQNAAVYFDMNGDGEVDEADRAAQRDDSGNPLYTTDDDGEVRVPSRFEGVKFVADLDGATDTTTGEVLSGTLNSVQHLASPLTNLLVANGDASTYQATLNELFGEEDDGSPKVTLEQALDPNNYLIPAATGLTAPTPLGDNPTAEQTATFNADMAAYTAALTENAIEESPIETASIALDILNSQAEGDDLDDVSATSSVAEKIASVRLLVDGIDANDVAVDELKAAVDLRVGSANDVTGGKPIAAPSPRLSILEDFGDTSGVTAQGLINQFKARFEARTPNNPRSNEELRQDALVEILGFSDPGGNSQGNPASEIHGIYINAQVTRTSENAQGEETVQLGTLRYDQGTSTVTPDAHALNTGTPSAPLDFGNALPNFAGDGGGTFYYVEVAHIPSLRFARKDFVGDIEIDYYVYDGQSFSDRATLTIEVRPVNDLPTIGDATGDRDTSGDGEQYILDDEGYIADLAGANAGVFTVRDTINERTVFTENDITLGGAHGDLFEVVATATAGSFRLKVKDAVVQANQLLNPGETYEVTLTATDDEGGVSEVKSLSITQGGLYVQPTNGLRHYSGDATGLLNEGQDGSGTAIPLGTIGIEGLGLAAVSGERTAVTLTLTDDSGGNFDLTGTGASTMLRYIGTSANAGDFDKDTPDIHTLTFTSAYTPTGGTEVTQTHTYVVGLIPVDELPAAFTAPTAALTLSFDEDTEIGTTIYPFRAVDPDRDINGDLYPVTYRLQDGDTDFFAIDANTGEVTLAKKFDFEDKPTLTLTVRAEGTVGGQGGNTVDSAIVTFTIVNVNEAPTAVTLSSTNIAATEVHAQDGLDVATLTATDPDVGDTHTFAFTSDDAEDLARFEIVGNVLRIKAGQSVRGQGETYNLEITATDQNGLTSDAESVTFTQGTLYLRSGSGADQVDTYSGGEAILPENQNRGPAQIPGFGSNSRGLNLGTLMDDRHQEGSSVSWARHNPQGDTSHSNGDFSVVGTALYYTGSDSGDFEAGDTVTVILRATETITGVANPIVYDYRYVFNLINIDDNDPAFPAITAAMVSASAGSAALTGTNTITIDENTVGQDFLVGYIATDADGDAITADSYELSGDDANAFTINQRTGAVQFKSTQVTDFETKNEYKFTITAKSTSTLPGTNAERTGTSAEITVRLRDVDEAATGVAFASQTIGSDLVAGTLSAIDDDAETAGYTYALVSGTGATDNVRFNINAANQLVLKSAGDKKAEGSGYSVRVQVTDANPNGEAFTATEIITFVDGTIFVSQTPPNHAEYAARFEDNPTSDEASQTATAESGNRRFSGFRGQGDGTRHGGNGDNPRNGLLREEHNAIHNGDGNPGGVGWNSSPNTNPALGATSSAEQSFNYPIGELGTNDADANARTKWTGRYTTEEAAAAIAIDPDTNTAADPNAVAGGIKLGATSYQSGLAFVLADHREEANDDGPANNNDLFSINADGILLFTGDYTGSFEDDVSYTVDIQVRREITTIGAGQGGSNTVTTDTSATGFVLEESYVVYLRDEEEAPDFNPPAAITVAEDDSDSATTDNIVVLSATNLGISDDDLDTFAEIPTDTTYIRYYKSATTHFSHNTRPNNPNGPGRVDGPPATTDLVSSPNGKLQVRTNGDWADVTTTVVSGQEEYFEFTLAQLIAGDIRYVRDDSETSGRTRILLSVRSDPAGTADDVSSRIRFIDFDVTPYDDKPTASVSSVILNEGTSATPSITVTDVDSSDAETFIVIISMPTHGTFSGLTNGAISVADYKNDLLTYRHGGLEVTLAQGQDYGVDRFTFRLETRNSDGTVNGGTLASQTPEQQYEFRIMPMNDAPIYDTTAAATAGNTGADAITIGSLAVEGLTEGGNVLVGLDTIRAYDPDDVAGDIRYEITALVSGSMSSTSVKLQTRTGSTAAWTDVALNDEINSQVFDGDNVRILHDGSLVKDGETFTFKLRAKDDDNAESPEQTVDIRAVASTNDAPRNIVLSKVSFDPADLATETGRTITLSATDEETATADLTYALSGTDMGFFRLTGNQLVLRDDRDYKPAGESYDITITVTDDGTGGTAALSHEQELSIPVRGFSIDWDTGTAGIQAASVRTIPAGTDSDTDLTIGTLTINFDPDEGESLSDYTFAVSAPLGGGFGQYAIAQAMTDEGVAIPNAFTIAYKAIHDSTNGLDAARSAILDDSDSFVQYLKVSVTKIPMTEQNPDGIGLPTDPLIRTLEPVTIHWAVPNSGGTAPDGPTFAFAITGGTGADNLNAEVTALVAQTTLTAGTGQTVSGTYAATNTLIHVNGELHEDGRLYVDNYEVGRLPVAEGRTIVYEGLYGTLTLTGGTTRSEGTWTYALNARAQQIAGGQSPVEALDLRIINTFNQASETFALAITVNGADDPLAALSNSNDDASVAEAGATADGDGTVTPTAGTPTATGTFTAADIDSIDTTGVPGSGTARVRFDVVGDEGTAAPDTAPTVSTAAELPTDETSMFVGTYGTLVVNTYTGVWTYTLNNQDPETSALDGGQSENDVFSVVVTDANGNVRRDDVTIEVKGTNDAPVLAEDTTVDEDLIANEAGAASVTLPDLIASGKFVATDDDSADVALGDGITFQGRRAIHTLESDWQNAHDNGDGQQFLGSYGTFFIRTDGSWSYKANDDNSAVQALTSAAIDVARGALEDSVTVRAYDTLASNLMTISVIIRGANDAPTLFMGSDGNKADTVSESDLEASKTIALADPDTTDTMANLRLFASAVGTSAQQPADPDLTSTSIAAGSSSSLIVGRYGDFTITRTDAGEPTWRYELRTNADNEVHADITALGANDDLTETIKVVAYDDEDVASTIQTITVTIGGRNDNPVLSGSDATDTVVEDAGTSSVSGASALTITDADTPNSDLVVRARAGDTSATADLASSTSGGSTVQSVPTSSSSTTTVAGKFGNFIVTRATDTSLTWTYNLNNADADTNDLKDTDTGTDVLSLRVFDGNDDGSDIRTITISITGVDDATVITDTGTPDLTATEAGGANDAVAATEARGQITVTDPDDTLSVMADVVADTTFPATSVGAAGSTATIIGGTYGDFHLTRTIQNADGSSVIDWRYGLVDSSIVHELDADDEVTEILTVTVGGETHTVTVTVTGANDDPELSVSTASIATIPENTNDETTTGIVVTATDDDDDDDIGVDDFSVYEQAVGGSASDRFAVREVNGRFEVVLLGNQGGNFDHETAANGRINIWVEVTDGTATPTRVATQVRLSDINDVDPAFTSNIGTGNTLNALSVAEDATVGDLLYAPTVTHDVGPLVWSISGTGSDDFDLNTANGQLRFKTSTALDADGSATTSYSLRITATSGPSSNELSVHQDVTITITDVHDEDPVITSNIGTGNTLNVLNIDEDYDKSIAIYTPAATNDVEAIEWSISGPDVGLFGVNPTNGILTITGSIDQDGASGTQSPYEVTLTATTGSGAASRSDSQDLMINVRDINDVPPAIANGADHTVSVTESIGTGTVYDANVDTVDTDAVGLTSEWSISDLDDGNDGDVRFFTIADDTGVVTFNNHTPDYDTNQDYEIKITLKTEDSDNNELTTTQTLTVNVQNPAGPTITPTDSAQTSGAVTLAESDFAANTIFYAVSASVETVDWEILSAGDGALFEIAANGQVKFMNNFIPNFEDIGTGNHKETYTFTIRATDSTNIASSPTDHQVVLTVTDSPDVTIAFTSDTTANVEENTAQDTAAKTLYTAAATDQEGTPPADSPAEIEWTVLETADGGDVRIDRTSGVVTLKPTTSAPSPQLNRETKSSYTFTVVATVGASTQQRVVTVTIDDVDEGDAEFTIAGNNAVDQVLTATPGTADPDVNIDGSDFVFTYAWYRAASTPTAEAKGTLITGQTSSTYTLVNDDDGNYVSLVVTYTDGGGNSEEVFVAGTTAVTAPPAEPALFTVPTTVVQLSTLNPDNVLTPGFGLDTLTAASGAATYQGGAQNDVITVGDFDNLVAGGAGNDQITLGDGVDTLVMRIEKLTASSIRSTDGGDTVTDFEIGKDKLVFVDVGTNNDPITSVADFVELAREDDTISVTAISRGGLLPGGGFGISIRQVSFVFDTPGFLNGQDGAFSGRIITLDFKTVLFGDSVVPSTDIDSGTRELTEVGYGKLASWFGEGNLIFTDDDALPTGFDIL
jgi:VCBS repeat-containing protein